MSASISQLQVSESAGGGSGELLQEKAAMGWPGSGRGKGDWVSQSERPRQSTTARGTYYVRRGQWLMVNGYCTRISDLKLNFKSTIYATKNQPLNFAAC